MDPAPPGRAVQQQFAAMALAACGGAAALARWLAPGQPLALAVVTGGFLAGAVLVLALLRRGYPHPGLGWCNGVTLVRLALAAALLAPLVAPAPAPPVAVFGLAALALVLDGADGWLARRHGRASAFGARFDMETDSALALILALNAWVAGTAGAAVLLLGVPRYGFAAAAKVWPWLGAPLPERFGRKAVCVLQVGVLGVLQLPGLPAGLAGGAVALVLAALAWSFGRDVLWLGRARA